MKQELIQTLHPNPLEKNKLIPLDQYEYIKMILIAILAKRELTDDELIKALHQRVKYKFFGGARCYGEAVRLDLEVRLLIERTSTYPEKYKLR